MLEVTISDVSITNVGFAIFLKPQNTQANPQPGAPSSSPSGSQAGSSNKVVPIFIGPLETYSISSALDGVTPPRPNTHDLIIGMLNELEIRVLHILINDIIGHIFYARIVIQTQDGIVELDARPSDSIAIAIRASCPIYMNEKVYEEAGVVIGEESGEGADEGELPQEEPEEEEPNLALSELERIKQKLEKAVDAENFEEAAVLRDKIRELQQEN